MPAHGLSRSAACGLERRRSKYQVGIVSAADCHEPETAYGIYTRISSYADWIKQVAPNALSEPTTER